MSLEVTTTAKEFSLNSGIKNYKPAKQEEKYCRSLSHSAASKVKRVRHNTAKKSFSDQDIARSANSDSYSSSAHSSPPNYLHKGKKQTGLPCHLLVDKILQTVGQLEHTLIEDHQHDFNLRMALERQTEQVKDLRLSLETEKKRNHRLVQLIRGVDSSSAEEEEDIENMKMLQPYSSSCGNRFGFSGHSRSSMEAFESISPLLMQQRYDELSMSHKQCRRQLVKKEKLLTRTKCDKEELQAKYDNLFDEYRNVHKRLEILCCKYLQLQTKKNQEMQKLREALTYASDCILSAQQEKGCNLHCSKEFRRNFQLFIKSLKLCEWVQKSCSAASSK